MSHYDELKWCSLNNNFYHENELIKFILSLDDDIISIEVFEFIFELVCVFF